MEAGSPSSSWRAGSWWGLSSWLVPSHCVYTPSASCSSVRTPVLSDYALLLRPRLTVSKHSPLGNKGFTIWILEAHNSVHSFNIICHGINSFTFLKLNYRMILSDWSEGHKDFLHLWGVGRPEGGDGDEEGSRSKSWFLKGWCPITHSPSPAEFGASLLLGKWENLAFEDAKLEEAARPEMSCVGCMPSKLALPLGSLKKLQPREDSPAQLPAPPQSCPGLFASTYQKAKLCAPSGNPLCAYTAT